MQQGAGCRSWEDQTWCEVAVLVGKGAGGRWWGVRGVRCWGGVVMRTKEGGKTVDLEPTECRLYQ